MSLEEKLRHFVRAYEEVMLLDYSAALFQQHAQYGQMTLWQLQQVVPWASPGATAKIFGIFDEDRSGTIDAHEFHKVIRYINFGSGYCDGCQSPVLANQHSCYCTVCPDYLLCMNCHGRRMALHAPNHPFRLMCDKPALKEHMRGLGNYLRAEIDELFATLDADGSGKVSHGEFAVYYRSQGASEAVIDHFLHFDLDGDGFLSKKELVCIVVAMRITRFCDECGDWEFPGSPNMLSCVECTVDYDVCRSCFSSGRCRHEHDHFDTVSMLQLRRLGLCLEINGNERSIVCDDQAKWNMYRPFFNLPVQPRRPPPQQYYGNHMYYQPPVYQHSAYGKQVDGALNFSGAFMHGFKDGAMDILKDQGVDFISDQLGVDGVGEVVGTLLSFLF